MLRACKLSLKFLTSAKRRKITSLLQCYRAAVNFFISVLWLEKGAGLDGKTLAKLTKTKLSARYKSRALKQAVDIVISAKKSAAAIGNYASMPNLRGRALLDARFVHIEDGKKSFDLVLRLSTLHKGHLLTIVTRKTAVLIKWLSVPGARIKDSCALEEDFVTVWVEIPDLPPKESGAVIGVDVGVNKLASDSDGNHYGTDFKSVRDKIKRRVPGSKGRKRAHQERDNLINRVLNQLPWGGMKVIGVEALKNLKHGKKKGRGKTFRKAVAPWTYRRILERIGHKADENRVRIIAVPPAFTSRTCPICGWCNKANRRGENFLCQSCGHADDADTVGAQNVLARTLETLGSVESPKSQKVLLNHPNG